MQSIKAVFPGVLAVPVLAATQLYSWHLFDVQAKINKSFDLSFSPPVDSKRKGSSGWNSAPMTILAKPSSISELIARVRVQLRGQAARVLQAGSIELDRSGKKFGWMASWRRSPLGNSVYWSS